MWTLLAQMEDLGDLAPDKEQVDSWWRDQPHFMLLLVGVVFTWFVVIPALAWVIRKLWNALQAEQTERHAVGDKAVSAIVNLDRTVQEHGKALERIEAKVNK